MADGLPAELRSSSKKDGSKISLADASRAEQLSKNAAEHRAADTFDDFDDLDLDFADITESLSKIGIAPTRQAEEADGEALNTDLTGTVTIQEWAKDPILPLRSVLLNKLFSPPWAEYWPESFRFEQWLSAYSGILELGYHERLVVMFSGNDAEDGTLCLLTEEHMDAFTRMTRGKVRMGLPLPLLLLHPPLRLSVYRESEGQNSTSAAETTIVLMKGGLFRKQLQRIRLLKPSAVFIDDESGQETLISLIEAYLPIAAPLSELSLELLFRSIDSMYMDSKRRADNNYGEVAAGMEPPLLSLSQAWRIQAATWLRNPIDELFTRVIEHVCNDWWLQVQPDPVRTTGTMLYVARDYQERILPRLTSYYTDIICMHPEFAFCPEAE